MMTSSANKMGYWCFDCVALVVALVLYAAYRDSPFADGAFLFSYEHIFFGGALGVLFVTHVVPLVVCALSGFLASLVLFRALNGTWCYHCHKESLSS